MKNALGNGRQKIANTRHKPEKTFPKLRQVDVLVGQGMARVDTIHKIRIAEQTFHFWRKQYDGIGTAQLKK